LEDSNQEHRKLWFATQLWTWGCAAVFLFLTLPLAFERPSGGRSAERQGFTAGIIRMYCHNPSHSILKGPQIHFGNNPFNLEYTGFEWLQGVLARGLGGTECEGAVEKIGKSVSIWFSAASLLVLGALSFALAQLVGIATPFALIGSAVSVFLLACDELWLRYATYTMVENRMLFFALVALYGSVRTEAGSKAGMARYVWPLIAGSAWAMTGVHKPQGFAFFAVFWTVFLAIRWRIQGIAPSVRGILALGTGSLVVVGWLAWGHVLGQASDLPWILHTGPRATRWYFGNWSERFEPKFFTSNLLKWAQQTGIFLVLPALAVLSIFFRRPVKAWALKFAQVAVPYGIALFVFVFLFWAVYIVHEYYALPFDVGRALATGIALALLAEVVLGTIDKHHRLLALALAVLVTAVCGTAYRKGVPPYLAYAARINDPRAPDYLHGWNEQVFPERHPFVVMTVRSRGSELLYLYKAKARGFVWCTHNPIHAPRKYWKDQGVRWVAWGEPSPDPATPGLYQWTVRSIEQELELARKNNWSSDVDDHWAGRTMAQWAAHASSNGKDPCLDNPDPRSW